MTCSLPVGTNATIHTTPIASTRFVSQPSSTVQATKSASCRATSKPQRQRQKIGRLVPSGGKQQAGRSRKPKSPLQVSASMDAFVIGFEGVVEDPSSGSVFPEAKEALGSTTNPFYILSTSDVEHVSSSLKEECHVDIPADSPRILRATTGTKMESLQLVNSRPLAQDPSNTVHYIDADAETLSAVASDPAFSRWRLYRASWSPGATVETTSVRPITLKDFPELLKWGLLMGVNDGCQEYEDGTPAA